MGITVKARVLLELGAELISSDQIAIYELVKNSLDARATRIKVCVCITLPRSEYLSIRQKIEQSAKNNQGLSQDTIRQMLDDSMEPTATQANRDAFLEVALSPSNTDYIQALDAAYIQSNWVEITDDGSGMSFEDLSSVYLTIGTTYRLDDRLHDSDHPVLGEKGIGRLSAVRLGDQLHVLTSKKDDKTLHELKIDWSIIKRDPRIDLDEFPAVPNVGPKKNNASDHGTTIRMSNLTSEWSIEKMESLAKTDFAKLVDPFLTSFSRPNVRLYFNGQSVDIPSFQTRQLTYAHARCSANFAFDTDGKPILSGEVIYKYYGQRKIFSLEGMHLFSALALKGKRPKRGEIFQPESMLMQQGLANLGPFEMEAHWFNRQKLRLDKPDGYEAALQWLKHWGGGLLLYRDHYRVYPYAESRDDWLDLDGTALAAQGYKMNRKQLVGAVRISSRGNPHLQDQTNREGLRDTEEKTALIALLRHILVVEFKSYLDAVEGAQDESAAKEFPKLEKRLEEAQKQALKQIQRLRANLKAPEDISAINILLARMTDMSEAWERSKMTVRAYEEDIDKYVHLAGVGLMTEFIFHELARLSANALKLLQTYKPNNATENRQLRNLRDQLSTLEKRIRVLDPLSTPGRQKRESFDLVQILKDTVEMHEPQFERHGIRVELAGLGKLPVLIKAVRGQLLQIVENFISNSVYWLKLFATTMEFEPVISFSIDRAANTLTILDNGPGIPEDRGEEVFNAFFSTKPAGEGRGMGLYIAKKLAEGNAMKVALAEADEDRIHHGFVVIYGGAKDESS
jgi:signal transduction histidine kinase